MKKHCIGLPGRRIVSDDDYSDKVSIVRDHVDDELLCTEAER